MRGLGMEATALGVARCYQGLADAIVIDRKDAGLSGAVEALGMACVCDDILMRDHADKERLARTVISAGLDEPAMRRSA